MVIVTPRTPILITGCQRSGTTLLNLILDSHPKISSLDEDRFLFPSIYNLLSLPQAPPFVAFKLPSYAHLFPILKMFKGCKVIWCVRNPLDTIWSMMNLEINTYNITAPWAVHPYGGLGEIANSYCVLDDAEKVELMPFMNEAQRIIDKVNTLLRSRKNFDDMTRRESIFTGGLCWRIKNTLPNSYKKWDIDFYVVRYEELVSNPQDSLSKLLAYIGADWNDDILRHHRLHNGMSIGNTSNTRPIDQNSVGRGIENLTQDERELIISMCGKTAKGWGYDGYENVLSLSYPPPPLQQRM